MDRVDISTSIKVRLRKYGIDATMLYVLISVVAWYALRSAQNPEQLAIVMFVVAAGLSRLAFRDPLRRFHLLLLNCY